MAQLPAARCIDVVSVNKVEKWGATGAAPFWEGDCHDGEPFSTLGCGILRQTRALRKDDLVSVVHGDT